MRKTIILTVTALLVGLGAGFGLNQHEGSNPSTTGIDPNKPLYWVAPMDANYRRDKPGKSPMGMDLVPVYQEDNAGSNATALMIDAAVINNIGVRTATVSAHTLSREIDTVGFVTPDENLSSHVHVRSAGWVEKLHKKAVGETVNKDDVVFELYSPDLVNAQTEFVQAIQLNQQSLLRASRHRLAALGMSDEQITTLQSSKRVQQRIAVKAPQTGVIMALNIGEGMYITPSTTVFSITDLSRIWVKAEIFEAQSNWIQNGQTASMTLPFMPSEKWEGTVDYVYPIVNAKSRTVEARLSFSNEDGRLKPNMYGEVRIAAEPRESIMAIPREALIRTGKTDRVILALEKGKFRPAEVTAGEESGNFIEISDGLSIGERIVTSGQFLIDSEASTNSAYLRLLGAGDDGGNQTYSTIGTLNAITDDRLANITHGPIDGLNMPGMTMNFKIAKGVKLTDLVGTAGTEFQLSQGSDGWLTVEGASVSNQITVPMAEIQTESPVQTHTVSGTINSIGEDNTLNISHGPIETLNMPGMRMNFKVSDEVDVSTVKTGDNVKFNVIEGEDGWFVIVKMTNL